MAEAVRVTLSDTMPVVNPGGAITIFGTIVNASDLVDSYSIQIGNLDPSWVEVPTETPRIFPEGSQTVPLIFKPPRSPQVAAQAYTFTITVASADNPSLTTSAAGTLTVGPFIDWSFELRSPRVATGQTDGRWTFRAANNGNARLTMQFSASDETGDLDYAFTPTTTTIGQGQETDIVLVARSKVVRFGAQATFQIRIAAQVVSVEPSTQIEQETRTEVVTFNMVPAQLVPPRLDPRQVQLSAQRTETSVILGNDGQTPLIMELEATDPASALAFEFVGGQRQTVSAGGTTTVKLRISIPDRDRLPQQAGSIPFTVTCTPIEPAGEPRSVEGEAILPSPADFRLRLEPEVVEGTGPERVDLIVENVSSQDGTFSIRATSRDALLAVVPSKDAIDVKARDRVAVPIDLTPEPTMGKSASSVARRSGFVLRVMPSDAPALANEVAGEYVYTPPTISMDLVREEITAPGAAVFDVRLENSSPDDVSIALEASDRAGACRYEFDLQKLRVAAGSVAPVRLTVTPPDDHGNTARWQFEIQARPTNPSGPAVNVEGVLIYQAPTVSITLSPRERRGRRSRMFDVNLSNPSSTPVTVRLAAVDRSGGLGLQLRRDSLDVPAAGRGATRVPLRVSPWKRMRGSGEQALAFSVSATPVSPPGEATLTEGRFIALPPRSRLWWLLLLPLLLVLIDPPLVGVQAFSAYEHAFYVLGWQRQDWPGWSQLNRQPLNAEHHIRSDIQCAVTAISQSEAIVPMCFEQGFRPPRELLSG